MRIFIWVDWKDEPASVVVEFDNGEQRYPFTKECCIQAGKDIFSTGEDKWIFSDL